MPLPWLKAGKQEQCGKANDCQVGNHTRLVVLQPAELAVGGEWIEEQQAQQHQADDHAIMIVDPEQPSLLLLGRRPESRALAVFVGSVLSHGASHLSVCGRNLCC